MIDEVIDILVVWYGMENLNVVEVEIFGCIFE